MPAYGCPTDRKEAIPLQGWHPFEGDPPAPTLRWLPDADATAVGYAQEARRRAASGTTEDRRLAATAFRKSLQGGEELQANWPQRGLLHTELAALLRVLGREDQALAEVEAALKLQPCLPDALLLKAQMLNAAGNEGAAALSAKQCWMQIEGGKRSGKEQSLQRECRELLEELGEACDHSLPRKWPIMVPAETEPPESWS